MCLAGLSLITRWFCRNILRDGIAVITRWYCGIICQMLAKVLALSANAIQLFAKKVVAPAAARHHWFP